MLLLCAAFISLGRWQWHKGNVRQAEWDSFERGTEQVIVLDARGLADVPLFQRVALTGRFDAAHQFLLDNRTHDGRAGYEVLTPLQRPDGRVAIVDRGWVPFEGRRDRLPDVALKSRDLVALTGRADNLPSAGLPSGRAAPASGDRWPKVTSYPTLRELAEALASPLEARILLLDPDEPDGYVRDWQPPGMPPIRHWSYAIQWWGFAALALALWVILNLKRVGPAS
jgi:surfeit locus 1 family protein